MPDRKAADLADLAVELERTTEIDDQTEQMLEIAAIVEEALAPIGLHPIIVGGLAVAYWTSSAHLTSDIDVVMPDVAEADARLEQLGFAREGRFWILPGRDVFLEAPGSRLEPSAEGFETIETRSGRFVRIHSADELLLQRLMEFAGTGSSSSFQQCLWLLGSEGIDQERLDRRAQVEGLSTALAALRSTVESFERTGQLPASWELKDLARRL